MELTNEEIDLLEDILELAADRARHYEDADMGWDPEQVEDFWVLKERHRSEAKKRGFWWAE